VFLQFRFNARQFYAQRTRFALVIAFAKEQAVAGKIRSRRPAAMKTEKPPAGMPEASEVNQ
jgi:hypothetical protein